MLNSARQVTVGNPDGDVTLVEFFDYNCGYCKRALGDMLEMMKADPKLRVVLKEFPVLGKGSAEAAQVAIAVRMQDTDGSKYLGFHRALLGARGPSDRRSALAAAAEAGLDVARLESDMVSDEVRLTMEENMRLARALGISATPSYVIGDDVVIGAGRTGCADKQGAIEAAVDQKVKAMRFRFRFRRFAIALLALTLQSAVPGVGVELQC